MILTSGQDPELTSFRFTPRQLRFDAFHLFLMMIEQLEEAMIENLSVGFVKFTADLKN